VERSVLEELRPAVEGRRALEVGCGAGAVTRELLGMTESVVGLDVSPAMVAYCRQTFSSGTFVVGDLGDLSSFEDASFDVLVAAANVVDVAAHEERPHVLREWRRVLVDGGLVYLSTHNRTSTFALEQARRGPRLGLSGAAHRRARALAAYLVGTVNHRRLARRQVFEPEYAIINDSAHRWSLLHHYITRDAQRRELEASGFELVSVRGSDGTVLAPDDDDAAFTELHYVARAV
jgi:SAM-dependent methyltransferase